MKRPWTRRDGLSDIEKRLRDERPRPDEALVRRVSRGDLPSGADDPEGRSPSGAEAHLPRRARQAIADDLKR